MNASRAFTLRYGALLPMGRVQTPTLALLVKRDREIAAFVPQDYWEVRADFGDLRGPVLRPRNAPEPRFQQGAGRQNKARGAGQGGHGGREPPRAQARAAAAAFRPDHPAARGQPPLRLFRGQDAETGAGPLRAAQGHHLPAHGQPLPAAGHARKGAERAQASAAAVPPPAQGPGV